MSGLAIPCSVPVMATLPAQDLVAFVGLAIAAMGVGAPALDLPAWADSLAPGWAVLAIGAGIAVRISRPFWRRPWMSRALSGPATARRTGARWG